MHLRVGALRVTIDRKGYAWTGKTSPAAARRRAAISSRRGCWRRPTARRRRPGTLEQPPERRRRGARHRQPHRPDPGDGRRLQLRAQQVQPRHAGATARWLGVQAVRLHGGDRSRLHAGHAPAWTRRSASPAAPGQPAYAPQNYDRKFEGPITLRRALEHSRNVPAVRVMEQLGPKPGDRLRAPARPRVARCRRTWPSRSARPRRP